jgi:hypothetical protein
MRWLLELVCLTTVHVLLLLMLVLLFTLEFPIVEVDTIALVAPPHFFVLDFEATLHRKRSYRAYVHHLLCGDTCDWSFPRCLGVERSLKVYELVYAILVLGLSIELEVIRSDC